MVVTRHMRAKRIATQFVTQDQSSLLQLPGELRNHIYSFVYENATTRVYYHSWENRLPEVRKNVTRLLDVHQLRNVCQYVCSVHKLR
jgi:hypothetical protein